MSFVHCRHWFLLAEWFLRGAKISRRLGLEASWQNHSVTHQDVQYLTRSPPSDGQAALCGPRGTGVFRILQKPRSFGGLLLRSRFLQLIPTACHGRLCVTSGLRDARDTIPSGLMSRKAVDGIKSDGHLVGNFQSAPSDGFRRWWYFVAWFQILVWLAFVCFASCHSRNDWRYGRLPPYTVRVRRID